MNQRSALEKGGTTPSSRRRFYLSLVCILIPAAASGCTIIGSSIRKDPAVSSINGQSTAATAAPTLTSPPSRFEYVELLDGTHWLVAESDRLLKTDDGGRTWRQSYPVTPPNDKELEIQGLSFVDERIGFLVANGQVLRTDNGGANWTNVGWVSQTDKIRLRRCRFIDPLHGWAVGLLWQEGWVTDPKVPRYVGVAFATQDGGRTWQRLQVELPKGDRQDGNYWSLNDVFFGNVTTGWLIGDRGAIFRTGDRGETWHLVGAHDVDYQRLSFLNDRFGWATYKYGNSFWGVVVTLDGGKHWERLKESFVYGTWPVFAVFHDQDHGFVSSLKLYETRDRGQKWKAVAGGRNVDEVAYTYVGQARDGTLVALGLKGDTLISLISTDMGTTWQSNMGEPIRLGTLIIEW